MPRRLKTVRHHRAGGGATSRIVGQPSLIELGKVLTVIRLPSLAGRVLTKVIFSFVLC